MVSIKPANCWAMHKFPLASSLVFLVILKKYLWLITCYDRELQEKMWLVVNQKKKKDSNLCSSKLVNRIYSRTECICRKWQQQYCLFHSSVFRSLPFFHKEVESVFPPFKSEWDCMNKMYHRQSCMSLRLSYKWWYGFYLVLFQSLGTLTFVTWPPHETSKCSAYSPC